jgi:glutamate transport system substrate-binding protein
MRTRRLRVLGLVMILMLLLAACGGGDEGTEGGASEEAAASEGGGAAGTTPGVDAEGVQALKDKGTVKVGIKFDQPLFGLGGPGGVEGFDAEIAKLMVEGIFADGDPDSHIEFVETVSANREPFIENGDVDMVIATYTMNEERDQVIDFAGPYYQTGQQLLVPEGNPENIQAPEDLNTPDLTACSVEGSTSIDRLQERAPDGDIITFDSYSKCAEAMNDGRVDAVTTDGAILYGLVDEFGGMEVVGEEFSDEPYGIGIPEGADDVRLYLNERICEIQENGEWATAYEETVGVVSDTPEPPPIGTVLAYDQTFPEGSNCPQATEGGGAATSSEMMSEPTDGATEDDGGGALDGASESAS